MPAEIRTPFSRAAAQAVSPGVWRKRVLPVGEVEYKGRMLHFDKPYLEGLAQAFQSGAYDQVPFQLADAANTHTNDPERTRGWITGVDVKPDGLWVTAQVTSEGNTLLRTNPNLGVSARIVEDYARSDGEYYPAAIQHVLGTLDPRITGLGAWEQIQMSNRPDVVIDLSAATFAGESQEGGIIMPELDADKSARLARLLELDTDQLEAMLAAAPGASLGAGSGGTADELTEDDLVTLIDSMTDDEFAALQAEYEIETGDTPQQPQQQQQQLVGAGLSNGYGMDAIEMANYRVAETERQLSVLQGEHDKQAFINEQRMFTSKHNIPPFITELARPLLEGTGRTVELSNGQYADSGLIMRRVLTAFGGVLQGLGLESPVELGTAMDEPVTGQHAEQERRSVVDRYRSQVGI
jgi:hypothetical protein